MNEMNKLPEEESVPVESVETDVSDSKTSSPKAPLPKLPIIIGGAIIAVAIVAVALILVGGHKHNYSAWTIVDEPTCTEAGLEERVCECDEKETRPVAALGHIEEIDEAIEATCTTTGLAEGKHCSVCNTVIIEQNIIPASHRYSDKYEYNDDCHWLKCSDCGDEKKSSHNVNNKGICFVCSHIVLATSGIIYDISADGTYYDVVGYNGNAEKLRIADTYQDLPVKNICDEAFNGNKTITSVIIPVSVTSIGKRAFYYCSNLTSIAIPNNVISIGEEAFNGCKSLTSVVIGASVTSIGKRAFADCDNLSSVVMGDSVISIGNGAFIECSALTSIVIPNSVTSIGDSAFMYCSNLTSIAIPNSVTSIGEYAFSGCKSLSSIVIPDSVTSIGWHAFSYCPKLQFNEYENCKYLGNNDNPYLAFVGCELQNLSSYTIHEDTKVIPDYAFSSCSRLASIVIPDSVTSIGRYAFYGCKSLTSVVIGDSVTSIGDSAFQGCSNLTSVVIPDSVTSIGNFAFFYCHAFSDLFYTGSEEAWKAITIGSENYKLTDATIHYNYVPEN